ncbi:MAG TPA: LysR family transcriptional regulator [Solirubrobacteraceae bacterium]|nr:LysR family transcriptional regulator [Solirubrobacteraceae bacterium]
MSSVPPFDLHRLRVLRTVARERSFSAAARALDYTQPAIGHHIRRLEADLGTPLVIRRGRTIDLTPAGEALVTRADALLAGASAAWDEVAAVAGLRAGRVRLATFPSAGATFVPPALARLRDAHPRLEVTLVEDEPPELGRLVLSGEADVGVSFEYGGGAGGCDPAGGLERTVLCRDETLAVVWAGHPLAREPEIDLAGLRADRFIGGCPRCRGHLVALCRQAGFEPDIGLSTDDWVAVQAMVAARLGVTLLPGLVLGIVRHPEVVVRPVRGRPTRTITALTLPGGSKIPSVCALLGALAEQAAVRPVTALRWTG